MIEQLRIQCPSCGIILDVRNSKHEAVKRITCPHCQKQLAIDFQEEEKPSVSPQPLGTVYYGEMRIDLQEGINQIQLPGFEFVEIKVVRLKDGSSKCMVRPLSAEHAVCINDERLSQDDEVSLAIGDELRIDSSLLVYGKPKQSATQKHHEDKSHDSGQNQINVVKKYKPKWPYAVIALIVFVGCLLSIKHFAPKEVENPNPLVEVPDTPPQKPRRVENPPTICPPPHVKDKEKDYSKLSQYELEKLAKENDTRAQYELGKRYVRQTGSNKVILGINYLNVASRNGSLEAHQTLAKVINALQRKADNGDSVAYQILNTIDNQ